MTNRKKNISKYGQLIAVTGGIGAGKSFILKCFKKLGFLVYSYDQMIAVMYQKTGVAYELIAKAFPNCTNDQGIDKKKLGKIVFQHPKQLSKLEAIVHPLIRKQLENYVNKIRSKSKRSIVVEVPLLFETGDPSRFDIIIAAITSPETQRQRVLERKNMTPAKFGAIISKQSSNDYRIKNSHFVIHSGCNKAHTFKQIKLLINDGIKRNCSRYRNHWA